MDNVHRGFRYRLSHDFHFDILYHNVSTTHCRSSSGNSVDLLSKTICTTVLVIGVSQTSLMVGEF